MCRFVGLRASVEGGELRFTLHNTEDVGEIRVRARTLEWTTADKVVEVTWTDLVAWLETLPSKPDAETLPPSFG